MITVTPSFYKDFSCIAGECPDSCCQGWEVDVDEKSMEYYNSLPDCEIKKRVMSVLDRDEFDNTIFHLADKKRCPFLNESNLCDMHIAIGGEHTPYTCRTFPRFINEYGFIKEVGLSFSCPVAADMMFSDEYVFDLVSETDDLPPSLNDIDGELYYKLKKAREKAFEIIRSEELPLGERMCRLLDFCLELQREIGDDHSENVNIEFQQVFDNPERINPQWTEKIASCRRHKIISDTIGENIAAYFIYRYFLNAVYDCDVLSVGKMAAVGVLIRSWLGSDSWTMHLWSKETEHSDVNMERYRKLLKEANSLSVAFLKEKLKNE